jgi:hypothetical protein
MSEVEQTKTLIKLREVDLLCQSVAATSPGSEYVTVLISKSLNMAVRWKASVSLRVEPRMTEALSADMQLALANIGFAISDSKTYASVHLPVSGVQAVMTIAAMIAGVARIVGDEQPATISFKYLLNDLYGQGA